MAKKEIERDPDEVVQFTVTAPKGFVSGFFGVCDPGDQLEGPWREVLPLVGVSQPLARLGWPAKPKSKAQPKKKG